MLQIKFQGNQPSGSGDDFFQVFTIYWHGGHLSNVTWTKYIKFLFPFARSCIWNLNEIGLVVSEMKPLKMLTDNWHVTFGQVHQITLTSRITYRSNFDSLLYQRAQKGNQKLDMCPKDKDALA